MFVIYTNQYAAIRDRRADVTAEEIKVSVGILLQLSYMSIPR